MYCRVWVKDSRHGGFGDDNYDGKIFGNKINYNGMSVEGLHVHTYAKQTDI
jgi:hypothetical protein